MARSLNDIAYDIQEHWKPQVSRTAAPYVDAMKYLNTITDNYMEDSAETVVRYFLCNAGTWRGEDAKRIKAELWDMLGGKPKRRR